jgi:hypothetical protein
MCVSTQQLLAGAERWISSTACSWTHIRKETTLLSFIFILGDYLTKDKKKKELTNRPDKL